MDHTDCEYNNGECMRVLDHHSKYSSTTRLWQSNQEYVWKNFDLFFYNFFSFILSLLLSPENSFTVFMRHILHSVYYQNILICLYNYNLLIQLQPISRKLAIILSATVSSEVLFLISLHQ